MQHAKIFLAEERSVTETEWFRSYNTFNFGNNYNEHKTPVEKLYVCSDDTLAGSRSFTLTVNEPTQIMLLPVVGAVEFKKNDNETLLINSGQLLHTFVTNGDVFEITNPYPAELVNFLQFWIKGEEAAATQIFSFNIDDNKNKLQHVTAKPLLHIVKLNGRKEIIYNPSQKGNCVFAVAVQGAFETEGILLHPRDGVAFWNYTQIETEALSNDAIIILMEV
jgi:quercetin 2,3-dioxygenase